MLMDVAWIPGILIPYESNTLYTALFDLAESIHRGERFHNEVFLSEEVLRNSYVLGFCHFDYLMNEKIVRIEIMESSIKTSNDVSKLSVYDL